MKRGEFYDVASAGTAVVVLGPMGFHAECRAPGDPCRGWQSDTLHGRWQALAEAKAHHDTHHDAAAMDRVALDELAALLREGLDAAGGIQPAWERLTLIVGQTGRDVTGDTARRLAVAGAAAGICAGPACGRPIHQTGNGWRHDDTGLAACATQEPTVATPLPDDALGVEDDAHLREKHGPILTRGDLEWAVYHHQRGCVEGGQA